MSTNQALQSSVGTEMCQPREIGISMRMCEPCIVGLTCVPEHARDRSYTDKEFEFIYIDCLTQSMVGSNFGSEDVVEAILGLRFEWLII